MKLLTVILLALLLTGCAERMEPQTTAVTSAIQQTNQPDFTRPPEELPGTYLPGSSEELRTDGALRTYDAKNSD